MSNNDEGVEMAEEETVERKKPTVRKSTVIKDSSAAPRARKTAIKKVDTEMPLDKNGYLTKAKNFVTSKTFVTIVLTAIFSSLLTLAITGNSPTSNSSTNTSTFSESTTGKVALTESELIDAVKKLGVDVYWAGPVKDAKYTLAVPADGQAYVRYLPNGQGIDDTKPNYVVIATYTTTDAFTSTQAAGNTSNGVTFINPDGAAVYYSKDTPTNVYVAYPNLNYQIEVFDPIAATALDIASKAGALRLMK